MPFVCRCRALNRTELSSFFARKKTTSIGKNESILTACHVGSARIVPAPSNPKNGMMFSSSIPFKLPLVRDFGRNDARHNSSISKGNQRHNQPDIRHPFPPKQPRCFRTDSTPPEHPNARLLYQRDPKRLMLPRCLVGLNALQCTYWAWFIVDVVPGLAVKEGFDGISYMAGSMGLVMSLLMLGGSCLYPRLLVGEISKTENDDGTIIKCYTVPLIRLETDDQATVYPRGKLRIENELDQKKFIDGIESHLSIVADDARCPLLFAPMPGEIKRKAELMPLFLVDSVNEQHQRTKGRTRDHHDEKNNKTAVSKRRGSKRRLTR